jgi:hypothetical protein
MAAKLNREDVSLGALVAGRTPTDTSTTMPAPTGLVSRAVDWEVLPSGASGQVLTTNADGSIAWAAASGGMTNPMTTAGDTIVAGASGTPARLAIGSTNQVLTVVSGAPAWAAAAGGLTVGTSTIANGTNNGVLYGNGTDVLMQASNFTFSGTALVVSSATISCPQGTGAERFGASSSTVGSYSTALGASAYAGATGAIALGAYSAANFANSIALGAGAGAPAANTMAIGSTGYYLNTIFACGGSSGLTLNLQGLSSTSTERPCGIVSSSFNVNTDASWTGNLLLYAGDYTSSNAGKRLGVQIQSNGSAALVGFYGATPVVQPPAGTGSTTVGGSGGSTVTSGSTFTGGGTAAYTINDLVTALKALGLLAP